MHASFYLVVVLEDNLSNGMNLLIAYQRLEIYLYNLICHCIIVNFLDQDIVDFAFYIQHNLSALGLGLQQTIHVFLFHLNRNGALNLLSLFALTSMLLFSAFKVVICLFLQKSDLRLPHTLCGKHIVLSSPQPWGFVKYLSPCYGSYYSRVL